MVRPIKDRLVAFNPDVSYFKPRGIPLMELEEVVLKVDECEAIRLADLMNLSHEEAGKQMGVSRATFGRIVQRARKSVADAVINGKAIRIEGGQYRLVDDVRLFVCRRCNQTWQEPLGTGPPQECPACQCTEFQRMSENTTEKEPS
jgi:predicted DNA-binding protein (UPF0251 family)